MIPHRQTFIDMRWPQPKSPIQTDNSTAAGVVNNTIVPCRSKMMDMHFWWFRCRASQDQFWYYWDAGSKNWADYNTKHHPDSYHEAHRHTHAGIWDWVDTCILPTSQTIGPKVSPHRFSPLFFHLSYFTTSWMLQQGCEEPLILTTDRPLCLRLTGTPTPPIML